MTRNILPYRSGLSAPERTKLLLSARQALRLERRTLAVIVIATLVLSAICGPTAGFLIGLFGGLTWLVVFVITVAFHPRIVTDLGHPLRRAIITVLCLLAIATAAIFDWPLRVVFIACSPWMNQLADRVASGYQVRAAHWIGPWRIVGSDVRNGCICLWTSTNPAGPSGFVRHDPGAPYRFNVWVDLHLNSAWQYTEED